MTETRISPSFQGKFVSVNKVKKAISGSKKEYIGRTFGHGRISSSELQAISYDGNRLSKELNTLANDLPKDFQLIISQKQCYFSPDYLSYHLSLKHPILGSGSITRPGKDELITRASNEKLTLKNINNLLIDVETSSPKDIIQRYLSSVASDISENLSIYNKLSRMRLKNAGKKVKMLNDLNDKYDTNLNLNDLNQRLKIQIIKNKNRIENRKFLIKNFFGFGNK